MQWLADPTLHAERRGTAAVAVVVNRVEPHLPGRANASWYQCCS